MSASTGTTFEATFVASARERLIEVNRWGRLHLSLSEKATVGTSTPRIIHVFDTDVMTLYSRPSLKGHLAALFRSEEDARDGTLAGRSADELVMPLQATESLLADILGSHFVWGRDDPALISPAHVSEFRRISNRVYGDALKQMAELKEFVRDEVSNYMDVEINETGSEKILAISEIVSNIEARYPAVSEADRLERANSKDRILNIEAYRIKHDSIEFAPSLYDLNGDVISDIKAISNEILKLILTPELRASNHRIGKFRDDALGLAYCAYANSTLRSQDVQLHFITGAFHLLKLATSLRETNDPYGLRWIIRHPISLIEEENILEAFDLLQLSEDHTTPRFTAFITTKLEKRDTPPAGNGPSLSQPRDASLSAEESWIVHFLSDTVKYFSAVRAKQIVHGKSWLSELQEAIQSCTDITQFEQTLDQILGELYPRFIAGLGAIDAQNRRRPSMSRNLPPIDFKNFPKAKYFFESLCASRVNEVSFGNIQALLADSIKEDPSFYVPLLCLALIKANSGDWKAATSLIESAESIAASMNRGSISSELHHHKARTESDTFIFGEEASYFLAVANRMKIDFDSNSEEVVARCESLVNSAIANRNLYASHHQISDVDYSELKYQAEAISLVATRALLRKLGDKPEFLTANDQREAIINIFNLLRQWIFSESEGDGWKSISSYAYHHSIQQLFVQLVQLTLLERFAKLGPSVFPLPPRPTKPDQPEFLKRSLLMFERHCQWLDEQVQADQDLHTHGRLPVVSALVSSTRLLAKLLSGERPLGITEKNKLMAEIEDHTDARHFVAKIDKRRFEFFRAVARRSLS